MSSVRVGGHTSFYNYSADGYLVGIHYASGLRRAWTYDQMHLVNGSAVYNEDGDLLTSIGLSYNWNGQVIMTTQPHNLTSVFLYDIFETVISATTSRGHRFVEVTSTVSDSTIKSYVFGDQVNSHYFYYLTLSSILNVPPLRFCQQKLGKEMNLKR